VRDKIDLLEDKLEALGKKEKIVLFIAILFGVVLLFYYFYVADATDKYQNNIRQITKLDRDIKKYSKKTVLHKILAMKRKILDTKSKISNDEQKLNYLNTKILQNNFLLLSKKDFTLFLNNLLKKSIKNDVLLQDVSIDKKDTKYIGKLKCKKIVQVDGYGNFLNTIKFIREIEEVKMMLQVKNLNIETNGTIPHTTFNILFYGIEK